MLLNIVILIALIMAAVWTVMTRSLLRSAIGLAMTSAVLTMMMFKLDSPVAAVFELSVCTGLISVLFISAITRTHPLTKLEMAQFIKDRWKRFWYLPIIVAALGIALSFFRVKINLALPVPETETNVRMVLWNTRQIDLIGQIMILLTGVLGVVILFKEMSKK